MNPAVGWRPPYDFAAALPTFVDAWPQAWHDLAPASEIIPLDRSEMQALGAQIIGFRHWFAPAPARPLPGLARRLDAAIARLGRSCFVRLTSRSPKDALPALRHGLRVTDGAQALAWFVEGSQRCAADLRMALAAGHGLGIVVRRWVEFPPWAEFRCFMREREWVGASQAHQAAPTPVPPLMLECLPALCPALAQAMERIIPASPIANAAFDLAFQPFLEYKPEPWASLLDANPLLDTTDTGLFPSAAELDRTLRFHLPDGQALGRIPLPP